MARHFPRHGQQRNKRPPGGKSADTQPVGSERVADYAKISTVTGKIRKGVESNGPVRGRAQTGRPLTYDPTSGQNWRTGVVVVPDMAAKAIKAANSTGLSFAGLLNELLKRMEVDENGRPVWADELAEQKALPLTG